MKSTRGLIALFCLFAIVVLITALHLQLPRGVRFAAPHQSALKSTLSRMWFSSWMSSGVLAHATSRILNAIPVWEVHAQQCFAKPPCNGYDRRAHTNSSNQTSYCYYGPDPNNPGGGYITACASFECYYTGANKRCESKTTTCQVTPTLSVPDCQQDETVRCQ